VDEVFNASYMLKPRKSKKKKNKIEKSGKQWRNLEI
jgi:hypothetical protein